MGIIDIFKMNKGKKDETKAKRQETINEYTDPRQAQMTKFQKDLEEMR